MKSQEGRIDFREAFALVFAAVGSKAFLQYPTFMTEAGATAGWQVALVSMLVGLLAFWPIAALMRRFPGHGLGEIAEKSAGWFGALLALSVAVALTLLGIVLMRNVSETVLIAILPETPPSVLLLGLLLCMAMASYRGVEPLGRIALLLLPLSFLAIVGVVGLNWNSLHWPWLYPFWGNGLPNTLWTGIASAGAFSEVVLLLMCGYALRNGEEGGKAGRLGIILAGLTLAGLTFIFLLTFGYHAAPDQPFPAFMMARNIYLGRFFQRVESIFVVIWLLTAFLMLSFLFHGVIVTVTEALRLPYHRPLIPAIAVIWFSLSLLPQDFRVLFDLQAHLRSWGGWVIMLVPALLLLIAVARKKSGGQTYEA